jgi:pyruvate dehydrogenase E2 component (dihydrolipoamide acetyltransferase)
VTVTAGRTRVDWTPMRTAIARRMAESNRNVPQFSVSTEVEMESVVQAVDRLNDDGAGERVTLTSTLIAAAVSALKQHPRLNACWDGDDLYLYDEINVGVAIAVDDGLLAPALLDAGEMQIRDISHALRDLVKRAQSSKLRPAELATATFTLSNLGMFDVSSFTAIVTPPQVAVLATSAIASTTKVRDDGCRPVPVMTATLSCDHRALDGVDAARFLQTFKRALEGAPTALEEP